MQCPYLNCDHQLWGLEPKMQGRGSWDHGIDAKNTSSRNIYTFIQSKIILNYKIIFILLKHQIFTGYNWITSEAFELLVIVA